MSSDQLVYNELMGLFKDFIDLMNGIYKLRMTNEEEIDNFYKEIKTNFIETKRISPYHIARMIFSASVYNNRYFKSYWILFKKLFEDNKTIEIKGDVSMLSYFVYKEYGILFDDRNKNFYYEYDSQKFTIDIHEKGTIYRAIMDDDKELFIALAEQEGFNKDQKLKSIFYTLNYFGLSLLELCCYHGSVNCFKLLRTKFNARITPNCILLCFLGGNPEIISECLKARQSDKEQMRFAIISHNIDFVTFLVNEYGFQISYPQCILYNNLHAFFVNFDITKDIDDCFLNSIYFAIPSLCKHLISLGANTNSVDKEGNTAFHIAVRAECKELIDLFLSYGIDVNAKKSKLFYCSPFCSRNE